MGETLLPLEKNFAFGRYMFVSHESVLGERRQYLSMRIICPMAPGNAEANQISGNFLV